MSVSDTVLMSCIVTSAHYLVVEFSVVDTIAPSDVVTIGDSPRATGMCTHVCVCECACVCVYVCVCV